MNSHPGCVSFVIYSLLVVSLLQLEVQTPPKTKQIQILIFPPGFPGGAVVKNPLAHAGDTRDEGSIPGSRRSPEEGHGNPVQYSCLGIPMHRGGWWATVQGIVELDNNSLPSKSSTPLTPWVPWHLSASHSQGTIFISFFLCIFFTQLFNSIPSSHVYSSSTVCLTNSPPPHHWISLMAWPSHTQTSPLSIWTPAFGVIFLQVLPTVQNVPVPHSGSCCHLTPTADCIHILAFLFRSRSQVSLIYRTSDRLFLPWVMITFLPYLLVCKIIHFSLSFFFSVVPCGLWDLNSPNQKLYLALSSESAKS